MPNRTEWAYELTRLRAENASLRLAMACTRMRLALRGNPSQFRISKSASRRIALAVLRARLALRYNPDQPRVPAGDPRGGQWTSEGGGGGTGRVSDGARRRVAQNETGAPHIVNLVEEEAKGGHAIREHVGKDDMYLYRRVAGEKWPFFLGELNRRRHGSFQSLEVANDLVNRTLALNPHEIALVVSGAKTHSFVTASFGFVTGKEAFRVNASGSEPYIRPTDGVGVLILPDPKSPRGYRVHTAYPRRDDEEDRKYMAISGDTPSIVICFHVLLAEAEIDEPPVSDPTVMLINKAMETFNHRDREEMRSWVNSILAGNHSDEELEQIWDNSGAECWVDFGRHRLVFEKIRRCLR